MVSSQKALEAARSLLNIRASEVPEFDEIHAALSPWDGYSALANVLASRKRDAAQINALAQRAQTNFLPLILDVYSQALKVDNYFSGDGTTSAAPWKHWQANRLDASQTGIHRAALEYGTSYVTVLPALPPVGAEAVENSVLIRGVSPRRMTTVYGEPVLWSPAESHPVDTDWPVWAIEINNHHIRLYDDETVYFFGVKELPHDPRSWSSATFNNTVNLEFIEARPHGVGVCPVVRFQDRMLLDGEEQRGIIRPLISLQKRIDETTFEMLVSQYFAAFKQRYVIGWMPDNEREAMKQAVSEVWTFKDPDVKVGQFDSTDLDGYIQSKNSAVRDLAAISQIPAQSLGVDGISNVSAEGLASLEAAKDRKASEIQTSFGESWEQVLRTAAWIEGDEESANDVSSEVKWADATARSFAQTVDGLGKLAQMLDIPGEVLWEDIPGWSRQRVLRAHEAQARMYQSFPDVSA